MNARAVYLKSILFHIHSYACRKALTILLATIYWNPIHLTNSSGWAANMMRAPRYQQGGGPLDVYRAIAPRHPLQAAADSFNNPQTASLYDPEAVFYSQQASFSPMMPQMQAQTMDECCSHIASTPSSVGGTHSAHPVYSQTMAQIPAHQLANQFPPAFPPSGYHSFSQPNPSLIIATPSNGGIDTMGLPTTETAQASNSGSSNKPKRTRAGYARNTGRRRGRPRNGEEVEKRFGMFSHYPSLFSKSCTC